jgi:hypothetical protein
MQQENAVGVGTKVVRQLKVKLGELRNRIEAVRAGTMNIINIWMKVHNKHFVVNFWHWMIPDAKGFCRANRIQRTV